MTGIFEFVSLGYDQKILRITCKFWMNSISVYKNWLCYYRIATENLFDVMYNISRMIGWYLKVWITWTEGFTVMYYVSSHLQNKNLVTDRWSNYFEKFRDLDQRYMNKFLCFVVACLAIADYETFVIFENPFEYILWIYFHFGLKLRLLHTVTYNERCLPNAKLSSICVF